jgi:hypothetical protein
MRKKLRRRVSPAEGTGFVRGAVSYEGVFVGTEFLQGIAVTAGDSLGGLAEQLADLAEGHFLPHMQMDHTVLLVRQLRERSNERLVVSLRLKPAR